MKKLTFLFCSAVIFSACSKDTINGDGPVVTENRPVSNFTGVSVSGSTDVFITYGSNFSVQVRGYSNLLPHFESKLVNNTLHLGFEPGVAVHNDNTEVLITMPALESLQLAGSGNISTTGPFPGTTNFETKVEGSGNIAIAQGSTQNFKSYIAGSGNIYAFGMLSTNAETHTTGSGNTEITTSSQLKVKIEGSGNVYYRGTPTVTANITGSGVVRPG